MTWSGTVDRRHDGGAPSDDRGRRREVALAAFGEFVADAVDPRTQCEAAARVVAGTLGAEYAAVLELTDEDAFRVRGAVGWGGRTDGRDGADGTPSMPASLDSIGGLALAADEPVVAADAPSEEWPGAPTVRPETPIRSGVAVPIRRRDGPWGTLEAYATGGGTLSEDDAAFLRGVAATLAAALDRDWFDASRRRVLERAPVGYVELDAGWRVTAATERAATLLGRERGELVGASAFDVFPAGIGSRFHREYGAAPGAGEPTSFEAHHPPSGAQLAVDAYPSGTGLSVFLRDVTDRERWARRSRLYELLARTDDAGRYVLDADMRFAAVDDAFVEMTGYSRAQLVGAPRSRVLPPESIDRFDALLGEVGSGERDVAEAELALARADGDRLPVVTRFTVASPDSVGFAGVVGVVRDGSRDERAARALTAVEGTARELLHAETAAEVCERVERTATDALGHDRVAVYRFDEAETVLRPAAFGSLTGSLAEPTTVGPADDSPVWEAFVDGERRLLTDPPPEAGGPVGPSESDRDRPGRRSLLLPLDGYGVLVVAASDEDALDERSRRLTELLATAAEAALARVAAADELAEREGELAERSEQIGRLERTVDALLAVEHALTRPDGRENLLRALCEALVDADGVAFTWVGRFDASRERLEPEATAGPARGYVDVAPLAVEGDNAEPAARAARSREPVLVSNVSNGAWGERWRQELLDRGCQSVLALPLLHDGTLYGVLSMCASDAAAFEEPARRAYEGVADATAYALNALESRRALVSDSVVELDVRLPHADDVVSRVARRVDGRVTFEGVVPGSDGPSKLYLSVADDEVADALSFLEGAVGVEHAEHAADPDDRGLLVVAVSEPTIVSRVTSAGAAVRSLTAEGDETHLGVELPQPANVRTFLEHLREAYPDAELVARRSRDRPIRSRRTFRAEVEERLTDRQFEVLRTAYLNGYFEWPRANTGEEIADLLGITQPTLNNHLRVAERKLLTLLFEEP